MGKGRKSKGRSSDEQQRKEEKSSKAMALIHKERNKAFFLKMKGNGYTMSNLTDLELKRLCSENKDLWQLATGECLTLFHKSQTERLYVGDYDEDGNVPTYTVFIEYCALGYKKKDPYELKC